VREAKIVCPNCGMSFSVYEDEVGEAGGCPGCGAAIEVGPEAFGEAEAAELPDDEGLLELLTDDAEALAVADLTDEEAEEAGAEEEPEEEAVPAHSSDGAAVEPPIGELDYRLWQGLAEHSGDWAMAVRLDAWRRAQSADCDMFTELEDGSKMPIPQMLLAEAAVARFQSQSEAEWHDQWTRRLLQVAAKWPDEPTTETVVELLNHTGRVIGELKSSGVWPWDQPDQEDA
jgi:hypothetical protein